jgi:hypothetical protein
MVNGLVLGIGLLVEQTILWPRALALTLPYFCGA